MRKTRALSLVAGALLQAPNTRHYGYELSRHTGVRPGVMYPILNRLLEAGWLADNWEDDTETSGGRPPRRYYTVTDEGREQLGPYATTPEAVN